MYNEKGIIISESGAIKRIRRKCYANNSTTWMKWTNFLKMQPKIDTRRNRKSAQPISTKGIEFIQKYSPKKTQRIFMANAIQYIMKK